MDRYSKKNEIGELAENPRKVLWVNGGFALQAIFWWLISIYIYVLKVSPRNFSF